MVFIGGALNLKLLGGSSELANAVTSYLVTSRMREIGVRMALGANNLQIASASMTQTIRLGLAGGAPGLPGVALSRILRATLYQTSPLEPSVFAGATAVLVAAVVAASYVPLRRALRVNPVDVLRSE
jgi:ABC-type antimicrobial peptide transport system permease subunit